MSDCVFCNIVEGAISSFKVYEDEQFMAFLDIAQITNGHTLVIPKRHFRWVWEVEPYAEYMRVVKRIATHYQEVSGEDMVMGAVMGDLVPHAHVHLLPKTEGSMDWLMERWGEAMNKRHKDKAWLEQERKRWLL